MILRFYFYTGVEYDQNPWFIKTFIYRDYARYNILEIARDTAERSESGVGHVYSAKGENYHYPDCSNLS
jgi:hypothetical protein